VTRTELRKLLSISAAFEPRENENVMSESALVAVWSVAGALPDAIGTVSGTAVVEADVSCMLSVSVL
jgi:hypothetical protein